MRICIIRSPPQRTVSPSEIFCIVISRVSVPKSITLLRRDRRILVKRLTDFREKAVMKEQIGAVSNVGHHAGGITLDALIGMIAVDQYEVEEAPGNLHRLRQDLGRQSLYQTEHDAKFASSLQQRSWVPDRHM